jgi:hypothetical protein
MVQVGSKVTNCMKIVTFDGVFGVMAEERVTNLHPGLQEDQQHTHFLF